MTQDINWDVVFDTVANGRATEWDKELVALAVEKVSKEWLPGDSLHKIVGVEMSAPPDAEWPYKLDLVLEHRDGGRIKVVDWKTKARGKLDEIWELRETRSPQRRLYAAAVASLFGTQVFPVKYEIRGLLLADDGIRIKPIPSEITETEAKEAVRHLRDKRAMRQTLIERGAFPWVRNEQHCRAFGPAYPCPREDYCWNGVRVPEGFVERPLSYSSSKEFLNCPELHRLNSLFDKVDEDEERPGSAGSLFHKAMECLYRQLMV